MNPTISDRPTDPAGRTEPPARATRLMPIGPHRPDAAAGAEILLVEDDPATAGLLVDLLASAGYRVRHVPDAAGARARIGELDPDLVILDIMLPDVSGLVLCSELRARWSGPILLLSATRRKSDPIIGLRLGADDFIAKPFAIEHLLARVEAALRHAPLRAAGASESGDGACHIGGLVIDRARCQVKVGGLKLPLTPTEYRLLCALADRPDEVRSHKELATQVWGYYDQGIARSLAVHMRRLRAKLKAGRVLPSVVSVRGFGYRLESDGP